VLVAGTPKAIGIVRAALGKEVEVATASTIADALQRCSADIALVITHVTFDESRMLDFLQALRAARSGDRPPVVCLRLFGPMSEAMRRATLEALEILGVTRFIDLYEMRQRLGEAAARRELAEQLLKECGALRG
jgi:DNA-binding response OmpR family regulator